MKEKKVELIPETGSIKINKMIGLKHATWVACAIGLAAGAYTYLTYRQGIRDTVKATIIAASEGVFDEVSES